LKPHLSEQQFDEYLARLSLATAEHRSTLVDDDINDPACKLAWATGFLFTAQGVFVLWPGTIALCCAAYHEYRATYLTKHEHLMQRVQGTVDIINADLASRDQPLRYEMYHDNVQLTAAMGCNDKRNIPEVDNSGEPLNTAHERNCCHGKVMAGVRVQFTGSRGKAPAIQTMGEAASGLAKFLRGSTKEPGGYCDVCHREIGVNNMASHVASKKHRAEAAFSSHGPGFCGACRCEVGLTALHKNKHVNSERHRAALASQGHAPRDLSRSNSPDPQGALPYGQDALLGRSSATGKEAGPPATAYTQQQQQQQQQQSQPMTYSQQQQHAAPIGRAPQHTHTAPVGRMPPPRVSQNTAPAGRVPQDAPAPVGRMPSRVPQQEDPQQLPGQVHGALCSNCGQKVTDGVCAGCGAWQ
jgi:hypothetical protein